MAWTLCPIPANSGAPAQPVVWLTIDKSGNRLRINRAAIKLAGLNPKDPLLMERDGERFRVRRSQEGEPVFGILSCSERERAAAFSTGGKILVDAGCRAGRSVAVCGDGWVEFDAKAMFDAGNAASKSLPASVTPAQSDEPRPKPWTLTVHPQIAVKVLRLLVRRCDYPSIIRELDVTNDQILGIRSMVGDSKIATLRSKSEPEKEEAYGAVLDRWMNRFQNGGQA